LEDFHSDCQGFGWGMMGVWRGCLGILYQCSITTLNI